jgi:predicted ATP-dependent serine protease
MSVVHHPWGDEVQRTRYTDITPRPMPSSLPCLGKTGFFLRGRSHLLAAKPKVGKTSLLFHLCHEWLTTLSDTCPEILWISEEAEETWGWRRSQLNADLPLNLVYHHQSRDWFTEVMHSGEEVIVVDTASAVMGISVENDNDEVNRTLRAWTDLCRLREKTLIISHHQRKEGGDFGDSVSGAQAWTRVPDIVLDLRVDSSLRYLSSRGRYPSPDSIYYDSSFEVTERKIRPHGRVCISCGDRFDPPFSTATLCRDCWADHHS